MRFKPGLVGGAGVLLSAFKKKLKFFRFQPIKVTAGVVGGPAILELNRKNCKIA
jgi:hypothetical protein